MVVNRITTMGGRAGGGAGAGRGGGAGRSIGGFQSFDSVWSKAFKDNEFRIGIKPSDWAGKGYYQLGITNAPRTNGPTERFTTYTGTLANVKKYAKALKAGKTVEEAYKAANGVYANAD